MKAFLAMLACSLILLPAAWAAEAQATNGAYVVRAIQDVLEVLKQQKLAFDAGDAARAAVDAVVKAADPKGRVLTADDVKKLKEQDTGIFYEAGIRIATSNGVATISEIRKDTPAATLGIEVGDVVEQMDKGDISALKPQEITELLRGEPDKTVVLKLKGTNGASREVEVKRSAVEAGAIQLSEEFPANLCYLKLNGLYERSGKEIVSTLRAWATAARAGVVIDLRGAGGSDLPSAADVAGLFAESGSLLFALRDAQDQDLEVHKSTSGLPLDMPAMVLVDGRTRGAGEVLAAALAGSVKGAMLIGAPTAGDPAVRDLLTLPDGNTLYLVTRRLVVADGTSYDGREGVKCDLAVEEPMAREEYEPAEELAGKQEVSEEVMEHRRLRERVRGDEPLRRAVDILLGLKALDIRASGHPENPSD